MAVFLYADDDANDIFFLERALQARGFTGDLKSVSTGQEAIDYLSGVGHFADRSLYPLPEWIFLDLKLPALPGVEVVRWIRQHQEFESLFIIVLSGSELDREIQEALATGANAFIRKPPGAAAIQRLEQTYHRFVNKRGIPSALPAPAQ